jgi:hypothetical protein
MPIVYPVPGNYLATVPAVPHECDDPFCVESGAFTTEPPEPADDPAPAEPADESKED